MMTNGINVPKIEYHSKLILQILMEYLGKHLANGRHLHTSLKFIVLLCLPPGALGK